MVHNQPNEITLSLTCFARVGFAELASAVSNAGGLGIV